MEITRSSPRITGYCNNNEFTVPDPRYIGLHVCTRTCCLGLFGEYPVLESYLVLGDGISKLSFPCRNWWSLGTGILKYSIGQPGRCESKISSTTCCPWKEKQIINIFHIGAYIQNWKCILSCPWLCGMHIICRSLFVHLSFFFRPLCCLSIFHLRFLITPLVSSNSSYQMYSHRFTKRGLNQ